MRITLHLALALCQLPSIVKDLRLNHLLPIEASPFQTERGMVWSQPCEPAKNKKPGVERRANPSIFRPFFPRGARRMNSKLDCFYPVLVTNLTSYQKAD